MLATATPSATSRVLTEDVLTLTQARDEIASVTGRKIDKSTICRWIHRGVGGTRLDAVRMGNSLLVSRQSLTRFIEARTSQSVGREPSSQSAAK